MSAASCGFGAGGLVGGVERLAGFGCGWPGGGGAVCAAAIVTWMKSAATSRRTNLRFMYFPVPRVFNPCERSARVENPWYAHSSYSRAETTPGAEGTGGVEGAELMVAVCGPV